MKKSLSVRVFLFIIFYLIFILSSCFSPWTGDDGNGTFTIAIGGGNDNGRWLDSNTISNLSHIITLSDGPGQNQIKTGSGSQAITFKVIPGFWTISVESYLFGSQIAEGSKTLEIKSGNFLHWLPIRIMGFG